MQCLGAIFFIFIHTPFLESTSRQKKTSGDKIILKLVSEFEQNKDEELSTGQTETN